MNELTRLLTGWRTAAGRAARPLPKAPAKGPPKGQDALARAREAEKRLLEERKRKEERGRVKAAWPRRRKYFVEK